MIILIFCVQKVIIFQEKRDPPVTFLALRAAQTRAVPGLLFFSKVFFRFKGNQDN